MQHNLNLCLPIQIKFVYLYMIKNITITQKIELLKSMKITKLRKNLKKIITWDNGIKTYSLNALHKTIDKYIQPTYHSHPFKQNLEKFTLIN